MSAGPPRISDGPWLTPFAPVVLGRLRGQMCQHADGVTTILRPRRFSTVTQGHVYQALPVTPPPAPTPPPSPSPSIPLTTPTPSFPNTPTPTPTTPPTTPTPTPSVPPPTTPTPSPAP